MGQCMTKDRERRVSSARRAQRPLGPLSGPQEGTWNLMSAAAQRAYPGYAQIPMTREVLEDFARALHRCLGDIKYAITGGAALAEYGMECQPVTMNVIVQPDKLDLAKAKLLRSQAGFLSLDDDRSRSECLG